MNSEICKDKNMSVADCVEITVCILTKMGVPSAQALVEALVNLNKGESLAWCSFYNISIFYDGVYSIHYHKNRISNV